MSISCLALSLTYFKFKKDMQLHFRFHKNSLSCFYNINVSDILPGVIYVLIISHRQSCMERDLFIHTVIQ